MEKRYQLKRNQHLKELIKPQQLKELHLKEKEHQPVELNLESTQEKMEKLPEKEHQLELEVKKLLQPRQQLQEKVPQLKQKKHQLEQEEDLLDQEILLIQPRIELDSLLVNVPLLAFAELFKHSHFTFIFKSF